MRTYLSNRPSYLAFMALQKVVDSGHLWTGVALALTIGTALAQPTKDDGRHPAYRGDPVPERIVRVEIIHTFEQRWEPVWQLLTPEERLWLHPTTAAPARLPVASAVVLEPTAPAPRARIADRVSNVCTRHGLRKVETGRTWRCRR